MASPTRQTRVWVSSRSWWWAGKPGVLESTGSQRLRHDRATEPNWTAVWLELYEPVSKMYFVWYFATSLWDKVTLTFSKWRNLATEKPCTSLKLRATRRETWCHTTAKCQAHLCWAVPHFHNCLHLRKIVTGWRESTSKIVEKTQISDQTQQERDWEPQLGGRNYVTKFYISKILCYLQEIDLKHREIDNVKVKGWDCAHWSRTWHKLNRSVKEWDSAL